jgi:hypothetical protein
METGMIDAPEVHDAIYRGCTVSDLLTALETQSTRGYGKHYIVIFAGDSTYAGAIGNIYPPEAIANARVQKVVWSFNDVVMEIYCDA